MTGITFTLRNGTVTFDHVRMTLLALYLELQIRFVIENKTGMLHFFFGHSVTRITTGNGFTHPGILEMTQKTTLVIHRHMLHDIIVILNDLVMTRGAMQFSPAQYFIHMDRMLEINTEELELMQNQVYAAQAYAIAEAGLNDAFSEVASAIVVWAVGVGAAQSQ